MTRLQKLGLLYVCLLPVFALAFLALHLTGVVNRYVDQIYFSLFIVIAVWGLGSWRIKRKSQKDYCVTDGKLDELEREITLKANNFQYYGTIAYLFIIWMAFGCITEKHFAEFMWGVMYLGFFSKGAGLLYYSRHLDRGRDIKLDRV